MDSIGKILDDPNDLCRELATEIFAVMCTHNIGRDAALKFIPKLSELFSGKLNCPKSLFLWKNILEKNENTRKNVHKALYYSSELIRGVTQERFRNRNLKTFWLRYFFIVYYFKPLKDDREKTYSSFYQSSKNRNQRRALLDHSGREL